MREDEVKAYVRKEVDYAVKAAYDEGRIIDVFVQMRDSTIESIHKKVMEKVMEGWEPPENKVSLVHGFDKAQLAVMVALKEWGDPKESKIPLLNHIQAKLAIAFEQEGTQWAKPFTEKTDGNA